MALEDYQDITALKGSATLQEIADKLNEVIGVLNTLVKEVKGEDANL